MKNNRNMLKVLALGLLAFSVRLSGSQAMELNTSYSGLNASSPYKLVCDSWCQGSIYTPCANTYQDPNLVWVCMTNLALQNKPMTNACQGCAKPVALTSVATLEATARK